MSNLINISTILIKRGNTAAASAYVGPLGELLVDTGLQTLRVQDGATPGGMSTLATTAQVSNVIVAIEGIQSNTANISALIANIHGANISGITSNVSILQSLIYGNVGNITLGDGNLFLTTYPDGLGNLNAWVSTTNNNTGIYISPSNTNEFAELYLPSDTSPQQGYVGGAGIGGFQVYGYNGQYTVNLVNNVNITANSAQWNFNGDGTLEFPDTTIQSTAYQGPAGQTDFATQANVVTANVALKGYVDSKIALLANAPAILDTLGQIATAIQNDEGNIGTILTNITATNANVTAANVAWQANAATQQGLIKTLQGQVYANANASAYLTTYLPTYTGNLTAGNLVVSGNINYLGAVNYITGQIGQFQGNAAGFGALYAGILSGFTYQPQTTLQVSSNFNGYAQINSQNINSGAQASSDFVATADNGTASTGYIDVGIASSTYSYPGFAPIKPNDGYVLVTGGTGTGGGNLILTTGTANDIIFAPNDAEAGRFSSTGALTTQGYQRWTVPATGTYSITAAGSRAGRATGQTYTSGNGAIVSGTVALVQGQVLEIICGQCLDASSGNASVASYAGLGGGGGTFVNNYTASTLLFAAGGGSGASIYSGFTPTGYNGANGQTTTWGGNGTVATSNVGGQNGNGGTVYTAVASNYRGGAGAGWLTNGTNGDNTTSHPYTGAATAGEGGLSYASGFIGGSYGTSWGNPSTYASTYGGFGGAGGGNGIITGGAGGGYSGGGQSTSGTYDGQAGGGGSYITSSATNIATSDGNFNLVSTFNGNAITNLNMFNQGLGYVIITRVS